MAQGCYIVNQNPDNKRDIYFSIAKGAPESTPVDQRKVVQATEETLTILRLLFGEDDKRFEEFFNRLLSAAQAGTVGPEARPKDALEAIQALRSDIVATEAPRRRESYLRACLWFASISAVISSIGGLILVNAGGNAWAAPIGHFMFYYSAAIVSAWSSLVLINSGFQFEDLYSPDKDRLSSVIRMVFYSLILVDAGILTASEVVIINLGKKPSSAILTDPIIALSIGVVFGLGITPLTNRIYRLVDDKIRAAK